jgi:hypothetical protein
MAGRQPGGAPDGALDGSGSASDIDTKRRDRLTAELDDLQVHLVQRWMLFTQRRKSLSVFVG